MYLDLALKEIRVGTHILYGIKQLHEVGYVHRDIKPANLAVGYKGKEARVIHMLDFGLSREYVIRNGGKPEMRRPRDNTLFRGTTKYCSANVHTRAEQGRADDLWSMIFLLVEMRGALPWDHIRDKHEIGKIKNETSDEQLLHKCAPKMMRIVEHLRTLDYFKRPDYAFIYSVFREIMADNGVKHSDPFDWETDTNKDKTSNTSRRKERLRTISEDPSLDKSHDGTLEHGGKTAATNEESTNASEKPAVSEKDFAKNEIGF
ncbi:CK1/TTBKL protein kinase [Aphelenchoides avenae]|nr:CK1/TTBKL protein kinase [Aphelenchus avenae]